MFDLEPHTIFLTLAGSQAHGTARSGSDVDLRGVCVAPLDVRLSLFEEFAQYEGGMPAAFEEEVRKKLAAHPTASAGLEQKVECVVFDLAKFARLCAAANPNALEILFADERDWLLCTPQWRRFYERRALFLTKKAQQTFTGYAIAQLRRIETHRGWLLNPPKKKPLRSDFGLQEGSSALSRDDLNRIEASIAEKMRSYGIDHVEMPAATRVALRESLRALLADLHRAAEPDEALREIAVGALRLPDAVVDGLSAEKRYRAAKKHWDAYQSWKAHRNAGRAELERKHGYDTKHATHLIRLMRMGAEVLEHGELRVRRDDADDLRAIRDGSLTYEALIEAADELQARMKDAARVTSLPDDVDYEEVDRLCLSLLIEGV